MASRKEPTTAAAVTATTPAVAAAAEIPVKQVQIDGLVSEGRGERLAHCRSAPAGPDLLIYVDQVK